MYLRDRGRYWHKLGPASRFMKQRKEKGPESSSPLRGYTAKDLRNSCTDFSFLLKHWPGKEGFGVQSWLA